MAEKKKFLLRIDESIYNALEKWASDDLRSINAQIEFLLKEALKKAGRQKENPPQPTPPKE
ncbi:MAG: Arc family DNA-binding protein [Ignavibacteriaceae bacterium]|nr:Arc family DNA-binding protein [Ignavibacteriaceae bacterium]